jgi:pimeloyl-ACP methyl ester carboxylesterase
MKLTFDGTAPVAPVTERPVLFASKAVLFGIVTEPAEGELRRRAVILVNAGADYHIGASGIYVKLARRWARRGYVVLRMDLAGLGDSGTCPGQPDNEVFPAAALDDIRAAVEWVRSQYGVRDITLGGVCSGAYHVLRAAVAAIPIDRILMINPEIFFWDQSMTINDMHQAELVRAPRVLRDKILSAATWTKLLRGRVNVLYVLKMLARRVLLLQQSTFRNVARRMHIRLERDLGAELEQIAARGVRMVFVFAGGEPGIALLKMQAGMSLARLGRRCRVHIIEGADHVFSKLNTRKVLEDLLSDELYAPMDWSVSSRAFGQASSPSA